MNDAFLQQVPHTICYVTTKETCPRTAVCLLPGPSPVCTACGPACAVYHGVGHTIDRQQLTFCRREHSAVLPTLSRDPVDGARPGAGQPSDTRTSRLPVLYRPLPPGLDPGPNWEAWPALLQGNVEGVGPQKELAGRAHVHLRGSRPAKP